MPVPSASTTARYTVATLFCVGSAQNAFAWICFSPIFDVTSQRFGVSALAVNVLSSVFLFAYLPASCASLYITERFGLRAAIVAGMALNALGCWLRYVGCFAPGMGSYALVLLGQLVAAVGQPFFTNLPTRVAGDWFPASQRDGATVATSLANAVGNALGSVVPSLVVASVSDIPALLLWQAVACTVLFALGAAAIPNNPAVPPSASSQARLRLRKQQLGLKGTGQASGLLLAEASPPDDATTSAVDDTQSSDGAAALLAAARDVRELLANRNFLFLCGGFGIGLGVFNAVLTLIAQLLQPCGYGADTAGLTGAALLGTGLVVAGIAGAVLEKTHAYVPVLRFGIAAALCATVFTLGSLQPGNEALVVSAFALLGAFLIPLLPVALENAAECTYPVPEDASSALLMTLGQLVGIVIIFALPPLLNLGPSVSCSTVATPAAGFILGWMALAAASIAGFRRDYRRQAAEAAAVVDHHEGDA